MSPASPAFVRMLTAGRCCHLSLQLCLTLLLLTIVVYIYTVIAFNFFRKFYVQEEDDNVDQKCHDMFTVSYGTREVRI